MERHWFEPNGERAGEVRNVSLLVASAVNAEGFRDILGICEGAKEDRAGWSAFLKHLKARGLKGVQLIVSDACTGLYESAAEFYPDARWQRCTVHWYRNIFSHVPATKMREVADMLKAIHASEDRAAADQKVLDVVDKLKAGRMWKAAEMVAENANETLAGTVRNLVRGAIEAGGKEPNYGDREGHTGPASIGTRPEGDFQPRRACR